MKTPNPLTPLRYLTRGDFARALGCSEDVVRKNERRWGLDRCRNTLNARMVRYLCPEAMDILQRLRLPDVSASAGTATKAK
ncbi:MAG: hypothetical protein JJT96_10050 [Opitutales bacterium]|nr:hypothetical protein [Opitutales bacterium]